MKKIVLTCMLLACMLAACKENETVHEHVPDDADCQHAQHCTECGELLAEHGEHDYSAKPEAEKNGYSFYTCRICGEIEIVNEDGLPVVPVE